jgi:MFS transporter, FSR family, fosmidomycin resistance protein
VLVGGWFADTLKHHILPFVTGLTILSALLMVGIDWLNLPTVAVIGMTCLSGLALGASRTPRDVMVKDAAPPGQIGKVFGFVSAGLPLGSAVTPVPFGLLIDKGHPERVLVLVAVILLLSLLCAGSARVSARTGEAVVQPAE